MPEKADVVTASVYHDTPEPDGNGSARSEAKADTVTDCPPNISAEAAE